MVIGNASFFPMVTASADGEQTISVSLAVNETLTEYFTSEEERTYDVVGNSYYGIDMDAINAAVAAQVGFPTDEVEVEVNDITVTYDYAFEAAEGDYVESGDIDLNHNFYAGGGDSDYNYVTLNSGSEEGIKIPLSDLAGTDKTITFSQLGGNASSFERLWFFGMGVYSKGKIGESLSITINKVEATTTWKRHVRKTVDYSDLINAEAVRLTYKVNKMGECGHDNHIGGDGADYSNPYSEYCPWARIGVFRIDTMGGWSEAIYNAGEFNPTSSTMTAVIKLSDIYAVLGTPTAGEKLLFNGDENAEPISVELMAEYKLDDIVLGGGSFLSGTIREATDWTENGEIPTGEPELEIGGIEFGRGNEVSFEGYKALKFDYTVADTSQMAAVRVMFIGWNDANGVGLKLFYYPVSSSGTVAVDLSDYQDKTYNRVHIDIIANSKAKIGDSFAPGFAVSNAAILTEYSGSFNTTIPPIEPEKEQQTPVVTPPSAPIGGGSSTTTTATIDTKNDDPKADKNTTVTEAAENAVEKAKENSTVKISVSSGANTVISANILIEAKSKNVTIELDLDNGVIWTIKSDSISDSAANVNIGVKLNTKSIPAKAVESVANGSDSMQISLAHDGNFGFQADLSIPVSKKNNGKYANLFHYNNGVCEFAGSALVKGGKATLSFTHASDYVVVFTDEPLGEDISSAAGVYAESEPLESVPHAADAAIALISGALVIAIKKLSF